jgi:hypothetical protein
MTHTKNPRFILPRLSWWNYFLLVLLTIIMVFIQAEWIGGGWYHAIFAGDSPFQHPMIRVMAAYIVFGTTAGVLMLAKDVIWKR